MEGIGLSNMLGTEELEKLFSQDSSQEEVPTEEVPPQDNNEEPPTAEVDFSDLLGNQSESVGSEETDEFRETPESSKGSGTPQTNLFSSIAKALRDEGVFPDLSDAILEKVTDAASLKQMFDDEVSRSLDERQKRIEQALNGGATSEELNVYQQALSLSQYLERKETYDALVSEGEDGEKLRKQVMYQDFINRGFKHDRAIKLVQKSVDEGNDMEDAKEAFESCKEFYKSKVEDYQEELKSRQQQQKANEEKQFSMLKKHILDNESFYDGVKVDKSLRQKVYDSITKPVYKDEQGNYLTALQKYQREHPMEFMENVALLMVLTDNFKTVDKLVKQKANKVIKSSFAEVANVLNNTRRNGDGSLNLANSAPDESRENWTLAI